MKYPCLYTVISIKKLFYVICFISSLLLLSGCSVIKNITAYNMSDESADDPTSGSELLSLPESTYIKNTLELSMSNPQTLNPLESTDYSIDQVLKLIYSPLLSVLPDHSLHNELIEVIDTISPTSARITLKDSLTFHNGLPLDTKDILFSFNYIKERPESTYYFVTQNIASITLIDALTFDIVFNAPDKYNYFNLTFPILSKEYVTSKEYSPLNPIGSGPYQLVRFQSMIEMELTQNAAYHDLKGTIPNISVSITRKPIDGYNMFVAKRIDVYSTLQTNWHEYSNDKNLKINMFDSPYFYYLGVNHRNTFLKEANGRKLVTSTLPYSKIKKEAFLGHIKFTTLPILPELQQQQKIDAYYSLNESDSFFMREYEVTKTRPAS
jgi:peptide/nickel transport system substrate-binding protein